MTTALALLERCERHGVRVELLSDRLRVRSRDTIPSDLERELREQIREVADALAAREQSRPKCPDAGPGQCFDCGTDLPAGVVIGICFPCRQARNPEAAPVPAHDADRLRQAATRCPCCGERRWWRLEPGRPWICEACHPPVRQDVERVTVEEPPPAMPFRVVVDRLKPAERAVRLNAWTVILDPRAAIAADMATLHAAVARMNAGWSAHYSDCYPAALDAEETLERLRACGCEVRVTSVS
jgi:hypothetical protein